MTALKLKTYEAIFRGRKHSQRDAVELASELADWKLTVEAIDRMDAASRIHSQWYVVGELALAERGEK